MTSSNYEYDTRLSFDQNGDKTERLAQNEKPQSDDDGDCEKAL